MEKKKEIEVLEAKVTTEEINPILVNNKLLLVNSSNTVKFVQSVVGKNCNVVINNNRVWITNTQDPAQTIITSEIKEICVTNNGLIKFYTNNSVYIFVGNEEDKMELDKLYTVAEARKKAEEEAKKAAKKA